MSQPYMFPPPPASDAIEWPGTPIGAGNTITRTKGRTAVHDKNLDRYPGRRDDLVAAAQAHLRAAGEGERAFIHDVVIHGVRVRAITNSPHLYDFWVDNWYSPQEWRAVTGTEPPAAPQVMVYAMGRVPDQPEAAYYSRRTNTIVFFNTAYYGQLKSWVLGAVGRVLAEEYGIHSVHGACVEKDGRGVLYIAPTGTGKSTSSYGLMAYPHTRFHSDDWVYIRYTYLTRDGRRVHPLRVAFPGGEVRGYRVFGWLEAVARTGEGVVHGLDTLKQRFDDRMAKGRLDYLPITAGLLGDKAVEAVLKHFLDKDRRHEFYQFVREIQELYEILSPDAFLRPYLDDYQALTDMYRIVRSAYDPGSEIDRDFLRKTATLMQKHTKSGAIFEPDKEYKLDAEALEAIASEPKPDIVKIFNLIKSFHTLERTEGAQEPVLIAIAERAAEIARAFEEGQLSSQQTLEQLEDLVRRYREVQDDPARRELSAEAYLVYWLLTEQGNPDAHAVAQAANTAFAQHPHWMRSSEQERQVRIELAKALRSANIKAAEKITAFTERLLAVLRKAAE